MSKPRTSNKAPVPSSSNESASYLESLRKHGRVIEIEDTMPAKLPAGVTHVLATKSDGTKKIVEKRKSFF